MPPWSSQDVALDNTNISVTSPVHGLIWKIAALVGRRVNAEETGQILQGRDTNWTIFSYRWTLTYLMVFFRKCRQPRFSFFWWVFNL